MFVHSAHDDPHRVLVWSGRVVATSPLRLLTQPVGMLRRTSFRSWQRLRSSASSRPRSAFQQSRRYARASSGAHPIDTLKCFMNAPVGSAAPLQCSPHAKAYVRRAHHCEPWRQSWEWDRVPQWPQRFIQPGGADAQVQAARAAAHILQRAPAQGHPAAPAQGALPAQRLQAQAPLPRAAPQPGGAVARSCGVHHDLSQCCWPIQSDPWPFSLPLSNMFLFLTDACISQGPRFTKGVCIVHRCRLVRDSAQNTFQ